MREKKIILKLDIIYQMVYNVFKGLEMKVQTSLRLDEDKFLEAKEILQNLGLNFTQAVNIFTSMVVANKGLPFDVKIPTKEFQTSIDELKNRDGKSFESVEELFKDLDN